MDKATGTGTGTATATAAQPATAIPPLNDKDDTILLPPALKPRRQRTKASFSESPLARPQTLVHSLAAEIQNYLYLPDPGPLYVTLGAIAANCLYGNPVWLILIGPASCGKTEVLETLVDMPNTKVVSVIKGPSVLLSGTAKREIGKGATGGLLRELGLNGCLIMTDMASMLKQPRDPLGEVLAAFRDIYGGRWVRTVGTDGARSLVWGPNGKLTFLAGSTPAIDRHHTLNAELGERWVYYRFPQSDGHGETQSSLRNKNPQAGREVMRAHVANFFSALDMRLDQQSEKRDFTAYEEMRLEAMAQLSTRVRSEVPRDGWSKEIVDLSDSERAPRLATVLGQLYLGLEAIGLPVGERWTIVGKVAMDSAPRLRTEIVKACWGSLQAGAGRWIGMNEMVAWMKMYKSAKTVERAVEDLAIHGVVEINKGDKGDKVDKGDGKAAAGGGSGGGKSGGTAVGLTEWAEHMFRKGWAE